MAGAREMTMKHAILTAVVGLVALAATAGQAQACRCKQPENAMAAYSEADLVVFGKVEEISGDLATNQGQTVLFLSETTWKHTFGKTLQFNNRSTCAVDLEVGQNYLLFLRKRPGKIGFMANKCYGNLVGEAAEKTAKQLPDLQQAND
jgi:hypothetical protein